MPSGSSPHKWGILQPASLQKPRSRFIPTQVGNTSCASRISLTASVHPHTSGEYYPSAIPLQCLYGSSPHKWGILHRKQVQLPTFSVHPHTSGEYVYQCIFLWIGSVHPHTSGEYPNCITQIQAGSGSSPHKWGILQAKSRCIRDSRFIPTQVGNTSAALPSLVPAAVHPHTSGEYSFSSSSSLPPGSSPHKWGILRKGESDAGGSWFIPTQVGNTEPNVRPPC